MKHITFFLFLSIVVFIQSQSTLPIFLDTSIHSQEFILQGKGEIYSSSLINSFTNKLLFGGNLSTSDIQNSHEKLQATNTFGLEGNVEFEYRNLAVFPSNNWGILVKTSVNTINSCHYTNDLFGVLFEGNTPFLGKSLQLNPSSIQSISYMKFGIGFIQKKTKNNFSINLFRIQNYLSSTLNYGAVYINDSSSMALIDLTSSSTSYIANLTKTNYGIGIDVDLRIPITTFTDNTIQLHIIAKNFGIGILSNNAHYYSVDTNYHFQGFSINDLTNLLGTKQTTSQQLEKLTIYSSNKIRFTPLLGYFQVSKINTLESSKRYQSIFGVRIYPSLSYIPFIYGGIQVHLKKNLILGLQENYGITNRIRTGMYIVIPFTNYSLSIGTDNLFDSFRSNGKGRSFQFKLQCRL